MPDAGSYVRLGTHNMVLPPEGPKVYPNTLDFRGANTQVLDFIAQIQAGFISFVQSIYVDNSLNESPLVIVTDQVQQRVVIPPHACAYMPLVISDSALITFTTTQANNLTVQVCVLNTPVTPYVWSAE